MTQAGVELRKGERDEPFDEDSAAAEEDSDPVAYVAARIKADKPIEGLTAIDINVDVIRQIDLAKESIRTGRAVQVSEREHGTK